MACGDALDPSLARDDPLPRSTPVVTLTPAAFLLRAGGVRRMAVELRRSLIDIGYDVRCATDPERAESSAASATVQVRSHLAAQLRAGAPAAARGGVAHSIYYDPPVWSRGPIVVTVHDMIHERFGIGSRRLGRAKRVAVKRADVVVCDSDQTRRDLIDHGLDPRDASTIPLGVSAAITDSHTIADPLNGEPYVLHVGDRAGYKNFNLLIDALDACPDLDPYGLVLVGGPTMTDDEIRQLEHRRRGATVTQLHAVDDAALGALYRGAAALVVPSRYEGFGLSVLEAMACGCSVASTRAGSLAEFDGGLSHPFAPDDAAGCAQAVLEAIGTTDEDRRSMVRHAAGFNWGRTAASYSEIYERVVLSG